MLWLVVVGIVVGAGTLGVIGWAERSYSAEIAHTMGVVTFSLFALFFSLAAKDESRTMFSLETFTDRRLNIATGTSVLTLVLSTMFGPLQNLLDMTNLNIRQWLACGCVAASIIVVSEIKKAIRR
jgi:Ca2+-transporting ATPase